MFQYGVNKNAAGVWGSVVSSPSGVLGRLQANECGARYSCQKANSWLQA